MLEVGNKVKDFTLKDQDGNTHKLSDHLGKKIVIYFYPKDDTPGCTKQACSFRDYYSEILDLDVVLYGISKDTEKSHKKFKEKYHLPFNLLSDQKAEIINYFGAYKERLVFGRVILGIIRSTFIIDENGEIEKIWMPASAKDNPKEVLEYLKQIK